jgi:hypothetical protein
MELLIYVAISAYIFLRLNQGLGIFTAIVPQQWQVGWYATFLNAGEFLNFLSATVWVTLGLVGALFEFISWLVEEPDNELEMRETRSVARLMFMFISPIGTILVGLGICALVCLGIPYGIFRHISRACRPAPLPATC